MLCGGCGGEKYAERSDASPHWVKIDLGRSAEVARMGLDFETPFANGYKIKLSDSDDASGDWTTVFRTQKGSSKPRPYWAHGSGWRLRGSGPPGVCVSRRFVCAIGSHVYMREYCRE